MPFHQPDSVRYYQFDLLGDSPVTHAVFTRQGGVSGGQWASLNVGLTVGDDPENVFENRKLSFRAVGQQIESLSDSWLVHGTDVFVYDSPRPLDQKYPPKVDIILTDKPDVSLFMRYADCVPILLYDPIKNAIGLAHAGWKGTVRQVGRAAVEAMSVRYGSDPADILAMIGPSIGPDKYEVGEEVIEAVENAFGSDAPGLLPKYNESTHFDLWKANRLGLANAGVNHIEVAGICTGENVDDWFSHRVERGKTGRFGALLSLNG
jgi:hypothetical protein